MKLNKVEYQKHNSFNNLITKSKIDKIELTNLIKTKILEIKHSDFYNKNKEIIQKIIKNIDGKNTNKNIISSEFIKKEITTLNYDEIIDYLIHRYRYEIYPEKQIQHEYPPYLQIEPSSICNYRCVFCFQTDNYFNKKSAGHMGKMSLDLFKNIIDQAKDKIQFISLASRGEPLLCPDINEMLAYTRDKFYNLKMNTNASILDEEKSHAILQSGIKTLVFSIDAADEKLYEKLRVYGNYENVLKNIKQFIKIKETHYKDSKIITRVSGVKVSNDQKISDMDNIWSDIVDQVAFVKYCAWTDTYNDEPNTIKKPCSELWRRMYVWWNGDINPCENDYKSELRIGNINNLNLHEAWNSEHYISLRNKHIQKNRKSLYPCDRCMVVN